MRRPPGRPLPVRPPLRLRLPRRLVRCTCTVPHAAPASTLTAAADKLRQLATNPDVTPGPWLSMDGGDRLLWDGPGADDLPPRYVVDEPMSNSANAELIAAMHPGVASALADLLEQEAQYPKRLADPDDDGSRLLLAVARAVLGADR
jgi:hypothetical protein